MTGVQTCALPISAAVKAKAAELAQANPKLASDQAALLKQAQAAVQQAMIQQAVKEVQQQK